MKNKKPIPEKIFLQIDPEGDKPSGDYYDADQVTWCEDRINENDIRFTRSELIDAAVKEMKDNIKRADIEQKKKVNVEYNKGYKHGLLNAISLLSSMKE